MEAAKIWLITLLVAMAYGVSHDMITVRVSLEYYTIAKDSSSLSQSPTLLALAWGAGATWYIGAVVGGMLAFAARAGSRPKLAVPDLIRPAAILIAAIGLSALLAGVAGYVLVERGAVTLTGDIANDIPANAHARFYAVVCAHWTDYIVGFIGSALLAAWVWLRRARMASNTTVAPRQQPTPARAT